METTLIKRDERNRQDYLMIRVTPAEACALIASLARQIEKHDPNTGRLESFSQGDVIGYVSISVSHRSNCIQCGKEIPPFTAKLEAEGFLCKEHETHREINEREVNERLEKVWEKQRELNNG